MVPRNRMVRRFLTLVAITPHGPGRLTSRRPVKKSHAIQGETRVTPESFRVGIARHAARIGLPAAPRRARLGRSLATLRNRIADRTGRDVGHLVRMFFQASPFRARRLSVWPDGRRVAAYRKQSLGIERCPIARKRLVAGWRPATGSRLRLGSRLRPAVELAQATRPQPAMARRVSCRDAALDRLPASTRTPKLCRCRPVSFLDKPGRNRGRLARLSRHAIVQSSPSPWQSAPARRARGQPRIDMPRQRLALQHGRTRC